MSRPRRLLLLASLPAMAGCAANAPDPGPPVPITYSSGACEGVCPIFTVTMSEQGGTFRGERFTKVTGERRFAFTPERYRALAVKLAPLRPTGERQIVDGSPDCGPAPTDLPSIEVRWGQRDRLHFYTGCESEAARRIEQSLTEAEALLGIGELVGT